MFLYILFKHIHLYTMYVCECMCLCVCVCARVRALEDTPVVLRYLIHVFTCGLYAEAIINKKAVFLVI